MFPSNELIHLARKSDCDPSTKFIDEVARALETLGTADTPQVYRNARSFLHHQYNEGKLTLEQVNDYLEDADANETPVLPESTEDDDYDDGESGYLED